MNIEEKVKALAEQLELIKSICEESTCRGCRIREVCMKISGIPEEIRKFARGIMSINKEGE